MSTKKTSTTTNQYNQPSMTAFNSFQPQIQANWGQDMQLDPTKSSTFNIGLQNLLRGNASIKSRNMSNLFSNSIPQGSLGGAFQQSQIAKIGRQSSAMDSAGINTNFLNYDAMRRQTVAQAAGFRPLQTGQTTEEKTSGLGTWLPQVIGMGAQVGLMAATGGFSGAAGAAGKASSAGTKLGGAVLGGAGQALSSGSYFTGGNSFTGGQGNGFGLGGYNANMFNPNLYSGLNPWTGGR
jgi:hypothetical protein